jgi:hypothetical protein
LLVVGAATLAGDTSYLVPVHGGETSSATAGAATALVIPGAAPTPVIAALPIVIPAFPGAVAVVLLIAVAGSTIVVVVVALLFFFIPRIRLVEFLVFIVFIVVFIRVIVFVVFLVSRGRLVIVIFLFFFVPAVIIPAAILFFVASAAMRSLTATLGDPAAIFRIHRRKATSS